MTEWLLEDVVSEVTRLGHYPSGCRSQTRNGIEHLLTGLWGRCRSSDIPPHRLSAKTSSMPCQIPHASQ